MNNIIINGLTYIGGICRVPACSSREAGVAVS